MSKIKQIKTIKSLKNVLKDGGKEFFLLLNHGLISRKFIEIRNGKFIVFNYIDDSAQILTEKKIFDKKETLIGEAIKKGAFYLDY
jgi:hypothetical protein